MDELSISEIFGVIGERFTANYLSENMDFYVKADSVDYMGVHLLQSEFSQEFDFTNLYAATEKCRKSKYCMICNDQRPCLKDVFYQKNIGAITYADYPDTGDDKFRRYCSIRLTKSILMEYGIAEYFGSDKFINDYLICHNFIRNYYYKAVREKPFNPLSDSDMREFHKLWKGHPGRLDYFAKADDIYYCIDSKVNSSRLSLWQQVRMSWMNQCGHNSRIYNIKFNAHNKEDIKNIFLEEGIDSAIDFLKPTLNIINYDPSKYPKAEELISNKQQVINIAKELLQE